MKPRFLGEGNLEDQNIEYWRARMNYWLACANHVTGWRKECYLADALGYEMLIDGRAKQIGNGQVEYT